MKNSVTKTLPTDSISPDNLTSTFFSRILFSHHIIADSKRSAVCNWAADLALGGFSKIGWPGLILVEGEEENCKIYVQSLQRCEYLTFRLVTNFLQLL